MYYREELIDGVWHYKTTPNGEWIVKKVQMPEAMIESLQGKKPTTTTPDAVDSTDDAAPDVVIREIIRCASSWVPDARLLGNVRAGDIVRALMHTIARAEPAPVGFDAAIKQLGEPDEATGHWSLDEGNLRWFVGQCRAEQTWQPIDTAPKDGTQILAYIPYGGGFVMQTHWAERLWYCEGGEVCPTHWMPLPTPPKED